MICVGGIDGRGVTIVKIGGIGHHIDFELIICYS